MFKITVPPKCTALHEWQVHELTPFLPSVCEDALSAD